MSHALSSNHEVIEQLGAADEIRLLRERVATWLEGVDDELRETLEWAFAGTAKHFRPLTLFGCHRAVHVTPVPSQAVELAFVVELMHNMSLIVDDVLDGSDERRGVATIHRKFGRLSALMASGYLVADAFDAVADDPFAVRHLSELLRRLGSAECFQWRLRRQPLGVEDWRRIAGEDTGSMFEICAVLGARSQRLRPFGHFLGVLYHGCDDVGDQRGLQALGGGGDEDIRDGILTQPSPSATRASASCSVSTTTTRTDSPPWPRPVVQSSTGPKACWTISPTRLGPRRRGSPTTPSRCSRSSTRSVSSLDADEPGRWQA